MYITETRHRHGWTLLAVHCLGPQLRLLQSGKVGQIGRRNDSRKAGGESPATPLGMNEFRGIQMRIFVSVGIFSGILGVLWFFKQRSRRSSTF